jgi:hypothetical protein
MKHIALLSLAGILALINPSAQAAEVVVSVDEAHHHHHHHDVLINESRHEEHYHGHRVLVIRREFERPDGSRFTTVTRERLY